MGKDYSRLLAVSDGKKHDVKIATETFFPAGSVIVVDISYVDYEWLHNLDSTGEIFASRLKSNANIEKVRTFVDTSENAARIQMGCSMIAILLLKYLKSKAKYQWDLSNLIAFLRFNLIVKIDFWKWVNKPHIEWENTPPKLTLFQLDVGLI